ncbi:unnamed protein product [marine sediment metagenome]|uniref:Uncharacterized protein n=1 Tax=marine sediment metagenome TaxID=412755 RepID=X1N6Y2_9ZZZZ
MAKEVAESADLEMTQFQKNLSDRQLLAKLALLAMTLLKKGDTLKL